MKWYMYKRTVPQRSINVSSCPIASFVGLFPAIQYCTNREAGCLSNVYWLQGQSHLRSAQGAALDHTLVPLVWVHQDCLLLLSGRLGVMGWFWVIGASSSSICSICSAGTYSSFIGDAIFVLRWPDRLNDIPKVTQNNLSTSHLSKCIELT